MARRDERLVLLGALAALLAALGPACTTIPVGGSGDEGDTSASDDEDDDDGDDDDDDGDDDDGGDGDDDDGTGPSSGSGDGGSSSASVGVGTGSSGTSTGTGTATGTTSTGAGGGTGASGSSGAGGGGGGTLCAPCQDSATCGGSNVCLMNGETGETFCGQDCSSSACPGGFTCYEIPASGGVIYQCVPDSGTCEGSSTGSGSSGAGGGGGGNEDGPLQGITAEHNQARANVSPPPDVPMPPLTWDEGIAATAQAYAEQCIWQHSGGPYGENLFATSGSATAQDVVDAWVSEVADYNYANNSCSGVCGHYTQVVWADSLRLGCGVASCSTGSPFGGGSWQNWVCNYDPPGNYVGQRPY